MARSNRGTKAPAWSTFANIAYRTGNQRLVFDPKSETFVDNEAANRLLRPTYRKHYRVPDTV